MLNLVPLASRVSISSSASSATSSCSSTSSSEDDAPSPRKSRARLDQARSPSTSSATVAAVPKSKKLVPRVDPATKKKNKLLTKGAGAVHLSAAEEAELYQNIYEGGLEQMEDPTQEESYVEEGLIGEELIGEEVVPPRSSNGTDPADGRGEKRKRIPPISPRATSRPTSRGSSVELLPLPKQISPSAKLQSSNTLTQPSRVAGPTAGHTSSPRLYTLQEARRISASPSHSRNFVPVIEVQCKRSSSSLGAPAMNAIVSTNAISRHRSALQHTATSDLQLHNTSANAAAKGGSMHNLKDGKTSTPTLSSPASLSTGRNFATIRKPLLAATRIAEGTAEASNSLGSKAKGKERAASLELEEVPTVTATRQYSLSSKGRRISELVASSVASSLQAAQTNRLPSFKRTSQVQREVGSTASQALNTGLEQEADLFRGRTGTVPNTLSEMTDLPDGKPSYTMPVLARAAMLEYGENYEKDGKFLKRLTPEKLASTLGTRYP